MPICQTIAPTWTKGPYGPRKYVNWVGISADGNRVIAGTYYYDYTRRVTMQAGEEFGVYCYDRQGNLLFEDTPIADPDGVYWVALSANGRYAAGGGGSSSGSGGFVKAYDVDASTPTQPKVILDFEQTGTRLARVSSVVLSMNGARLLAGGDQMYVFALQDGAYTLTDTLGTGWNVISVAMSQAGASYVFSDAGGGVYLVANGNAPVKWTVPGTSKVAHFVAMSNDGQSFAAAGSDGLVYFFDATTFAAGAGPVWSYPETPLAAPFYACAISGDGQYVSAVVNDGANAGKAFLLDRSGTLQPGWSGMEVDGNPNSTSMDENAYGVTVATGHPDGTPGRYYLFYRSGACYLLYQVGNMSWPMLISSDASAVVAGSDDSHVYYWDFLQATGVRGRTGS